MVASVANARKANTSGASSTTTTSFTSTAGGTIWVGVSDASGQGSLTISDNKGNTYTQIGTTRTSASGAQIRRYYCANIAGGAGHTVTATWGSNSDATVHVLELAGVDTASLDSAASAQADDSNPPWTVTSGTLAQADSIAVAMTGTAFNGTWSESSGFTVQTQEGDNNLYWTGCAASRVVAATTALTPSFTISGGGSDCAVAIDVFKASAGGGGASITGAGQIASAEALGQPALSVGIAAAGVASAEAFGAVAVSAGVSAAGIATAEAFGSPSVSPSVSAAGVASAEAFGSPALAVAIGAAGIGTGEAFGQPSVSISGEVIAVGIQSAEAFGAPTISIDGVVQLLGGGPGGPRKRRGGTESYLERLLGRPLYEIEPEEIEVIEQAAEEAAKAPQPPKREEAEESLREYGLALKEAYVQIFIELEQKKRQAMEEEEMMAVIAVCL
jgi:hypothetical protein